MTTEPFSDELLDELISADLDGEFDAAVRDLGLDAESARARLEATPGAATRRRQLAATRDALPVPPLDEMTRRRLVRTALGTSEVADEPVATDLEFRGHRPTRRAPWPMIAAVAAALVFVVGLGTALTTLGDDNGTLTAAEQAIDDSSAEIDLSFEVSGADVADPDQLRSLMGVGEESFASDDTSAATEPFGGAGGNGVAETGAAVAPAADQADGDASLDAEAAEEPTAERTSEAPELRADLSETNVARCLGAFTEQFGASYDRIIVAVHDDTPAVVFVFATESVNAAVVLDASTCALLASAGAPF